MPAVALVYALMSAVSSAVWNMLLKGAKDNEAATAVAIGVGAVLFAPTLALGHLPGRSWPFVVASAAFELVYFTLLATAYRRAEMSLVFPLARGMAPILVLLVGVGFLHVSATSGELIGVVVIAAGAVAVRGLRVAGGLRDVGLAALISGCIAGYTLIDKQGVKVADPVAYFEVIVILVAVPYGILIGRVKGVAVLRRELGWRPVAIGIGVIGGYDLILESLRLAAAAPVAAVRESSVVIGTGLAAVILHEKVGPLRWAGVALVAAGVVVLALFT